MRPRAIPRRAVLHGGLAGLAAVFARSLPSCKRSEPPPTTSIEAGAGNEFPYTPVARPKLVSRIAEIGPLGGPDANGVRLPPGFTSRIVATAGESPVPGKPHVWHGAPDGGATFPLADGGWIYVSNSELPFVGGVSALRFDPSGALVDSYRILENTSVNCAGGPTPYDTWLSCEEITKGKVFECDPRGAIDPVARPALGVFKHEAAAVDPVAHRVYLTEDEPDGCLYRFVPDGLTRTGFGDLARGRLEVAEVGDGGRVVWHPLPDPQYEGDTPTREQVDAATHFKGGEGIWWHAGVVYFSTKGDDRIWAYDTAQETLRVFYDADARDGFLTGVDNVTVSCCGDVLVAEDGGDMEIVAVLPSGELRALVQVVGHDESEITGPAFDPSGTRLYFSSQRGGPGGVTFEVTGPFHAAG